MSPLNEALLAGGAFIGGLAFGVLVTVRIMRLVMTHVTAVTDVTDSRRGFAKR